MAVNVGDVVRIVARMVLDGTDDVVNVYHFKVDVNTTVDDTAFMAEVALQIDFLYGLIVARIATNVAFVSIDGQNVTQDVLLPSASWPVLVAGTDPSDMLPEMNTACVFHRTVTPRVRASKFLPPTGEDSNITGSLGPGYVTLLQAFGAFLLAPVIGPNIGLSYVAYNIALGLARPVVSFIVPARFRTQRRRRKSVGS